MKNEETKAAVYIEDSYGDLTGARITGSGADGLVVRGKSNVTFDRANISDNAGTGVDIRGGARFSGIDAIIENNHSLASIYNGLGLTQNEIEPHQLNELVRSAIQQKQQEHSDTAIKRSLQAAALAVGLATEPVLAAVALIAQGSLHALTTLSQKLRQ